MKSPQHPAPPLRGAEETLPKTADYTGWVLLSLKRGAWVPVSLIVIHAIALFGFDAYTWFPPIDIPMHFFGGVSAAYFLRHAAMAASECGICPPLNSTTRNRLVLVAVFGVTIVWEVAEYLMDHNFGTHLQLGISDTLGDMAMGVLGATTLLFCKSRTV